MAALPKFKRIQREDVKEAPKWIDKLIYILSDFMDAVYNALNHNLTVQENLAAYFYTFTIKAGAAATNNTITFSLPSYIPTPKACYVVAASLVAVNYAPITSAVWASWRVGSGQILIDAITGLTSGNSYSVTVKVE